jgi:tetratricopeptide (TPR) repeat protein
MSSSQAEENFTKGVQSLANGHLYLALVCFEQAIQLERSPLCCSYLAFCLAKARGQFAEAVNLCEEALSKDPGNYVHYLKLGRVHLLAGQREKAINVFRQGLQFDGADEIVRELVSLGTRKQPVIKSLNREHPLNKICGIMMKKLGYR